MLWVSSRQCHSPSGFFKASPLAEGTMISSEVWHTILAPELAKSAFKVNMGCAWLMTCPRLLSHQGPCDSAVLVACSLLQGHRVHPKQAAGPSSKLERHMAAKQMRWACMHACSQTWPSVHCLLPQKMEHKTGAISRKHWCCSARA